MFLVARLVMPRNPKPKIGARPYRKSTDDVDGPMEIALRQITEDGVSINKAAKDNGLAYGTLYNKFHGKHGQKPGFTSVYR